MTMPTVEKLEDVYTKILRICTREINRIEEAGGLAGQDAKLLESLEKVVLHALEYTAGKKEPDEYGDLSDEELLKELDSKA